MDLHHLQLSSEGGSHDASNLITLCSLDHRAAHRGGLLVTGRASDHLTFRRADGSEYGKAPDPRVAELNTKAFAALRKLGFREGRDTPSAQRSMRATRPNAFAGGPFFASIHGSLLVSVEVTDRQKLAAGLQTTLTAPRADRESDLVARPSLVSRADEDLASHQHHGGIVVEFSIAASPELFEAWSV